MPRDAVERTWILLLADRQLSAEAVDDRRSNVGVVGFRVVCQVHLCHPSSHAAEVRFRRLTESPDVEDRLERLLSDSIAVALHPLADDEVRQSHAHCLDEFLVRHVTGHANANDPVDIVQTNDAIQVGSWIDCDDVHCCFKKISVAACIHPSPRSEPFS